MGLIDGLEGVVKEIARLTLQTTVGALIAPYHNSVLTQETGMLRSYFSTPAGMQTLLDFYFRAESEPLDEPVGSLHRENNIFTFYDVDLEKTKYVAAIYSRDVTLLQELQLGLQADIQGALSRGYKNPIARELSGLIDGLIVGDTNPSTVYSVYNGWCKAWVGRRTREEHDIVIHMHPHSDFIDGYRVVKGYSRCDKRSSRTKTLGLIEYDHKVLDDHVLSIDFDIFHRLGLTQREVGHATVEVKPSGFAQGTMGNKSHEFRFDRKVLTRIGAFQRLIDSPYVLPFLDFDPNEELSKCVRFPKEYDAQERAEVVAIMAEAELSSIDDVKSLWGITPREYLAMANQDTKS